MKNKMDSTDSIINSLRIEANTVFNPMYALTMREAANRLSDLEYTLMGVMHSVDKWLEGDELEQDEVNRAVTMREKTLQIIENIETEVARKIFDDIENLKFTEYDWTDRVEWDGIAELKKKYKV